MPAQSFYNFNVKLLSSLFTVLLFGVLSHHGNNLWAQGEEVTLEDYEKLRINEILSSNTTVRPQNWNCDVKDMVEIMNTSTKVLSLDHPEFGVLQLTDHSDIPGLPGFVRKLSFRGLLANSILPGEKIVIFCDEIEPVARNATCDRIRSQTDLNEIHAPFRLDRDGETLTLELLPRRPEGGFDDPIELHTISFPPMPRNFSFVRFPEATENKTEFVFSREPTFGTCRPPQIENGSSCLGAPNREPNVAGFGPDIKLIDYSTSQPRPDESLKFRVRVMDDKVPSAENFQSVRINFFLNGNNNVQLSSEMRFVKLFEIPVQDEPLDEEGKPRFNLHKWSVWEGEIPGQPDGTEIKWTFFALDVDGLHGVAGERGSTSPYKTIVVDPIKNDFMPMITEVVANNQTILPDPAEDPEDCPDEIPNCNFDDFIEIHNPTDDPIDLSGAHVSKDPFTNFPGVQPLFRNNNILEPGERIIVWVDNDGWINQQPGIHVGLLQDRSQEYFRYDVNGYGRTPPPSERIFNQMDPVEEAIYLYMQTNDGLRIVSSARWGSPGRYVGGAGAEPSIEPLEVRSDEAVRDRIGSIDEEGNFLEGALARFTLPDGSTILRTVGKDDVTPGKPNSTPLEPGQRFLRGDVTDDGKLDITDPIQLLTLQFLGDVEVLCMDAGDFDDNGKIEITDPIASLSHQFLGTAGPPAPGGEDCGEDPTPDDLDCLFFAQCP